MLARTFLVAGTVMFTIVAPVVARADQPNAADKRYMESALKEAKMSFAAGQAKACGLRSSAWLESITSLLAEMAHGFALQAHVSDRSEAKTNAIIANHMPATKTDFATCKRLIPNPDLAILDEIYLKYGRRE